MAIQSKGLDEGFWLRQGNEALLAQHLDPRQACLLCGDARNFYITQQEFSRNLLYRPAVDTKVQQFGGERSELANFRRARRSSANGELHRPAGYVMQRASLPQPPDNLLIISRKLDDIDSRTQLETAVRGKQLFTVS